jgi:hypothetical protein
LAGCFGAARRRHFAGFRRGIGERHVLAYSRVESCHGVHMPKATFTLTRVAHSPEAALAFDPPEPAAKGKRHS